MDSSTEEIIEVVPLGAGQDVGRSCVIVRLKDKRIMFDVGVHMVYTDMKRLPDFDFLKKGKNINEVVDVVLVTHFHLDHCGALPYLTEHHGYSGPILCSTPTKSMLYYMLDDYRKVVSDQKSQVQAVNYTTEEIRHCVDMIQPIGLYETVDVGGVKVTSYYAGHVLGASMFHVEYQGLSVVYTGDYNSNSDRHLGAAYIPRLRPNIVLTETTYATTIRDSKRDRQRDMLKYINQTLDRGGKVLIPVFALGRAQELCVLLQTYWNRTQNPAPIYFTAGMIEKANFYYKLFFDWENQHIQDTFLESNLFDFKRIKPFDKTLIRANTPMVLLATPGMLHGGSSLQVFKQWCGSQDNCIIIPGYCVAGTVGNKLLSGVKELTIDKKTYDIKMRIANISFSAHADAKGIINLLRHLDAEAVVFVHGDKSKMKVLQEVVQEQLSKRVYMPENFESCKIAVKAPSLQVQTETREAVGYVMRLNQQNRFVLEDQLLVEANRMIEQILSTEAAIRSIICCGKVQTRLELALQQRLLTHSAVKDDPISFFRRFLLTTLQRKAGPPVSENDFILELHDNILTTIAQHTLCLELHGYLTRLNEHPTL